MNIPANLLYTREHEWIRVEGDEGVVGITNNAQSELGEIVYVELPDVGDSFNVNDEFGTIESVKAVSELFMPIPGTVVAINEAVQDSPELINEDPYGEGWLIRIKIQDTGELDTLMDATQYEEYLSESG